ncbi:MAG: NAD(P)-dependent oxidoreductase [Desulfobacterales bacterium]|nr:NAD(P)-dependent oxidoreductase [Desulfobacterales bacterium]
MTERLNLVTGSCGFCGSHLVKLLIDKGEKVIATDLEGAFKSERNKKVFNNIGLDFNHKNVEFIPSDLLKKETLKPLFDKPITHLFHTASLYDYSASLEKLMKINVDGFTNLGELAIKANLTQFIHWSTCGVFGKPHPACEKEKCNIPFTEESSSPKNTPFDQESPTNTNIVNEYSFTKWKQEQIAWKYYRENKLPLTVIRPAPIYGEGSDYGHGGIILTINKGYLPVVPLDAKNYITTSVNVIDLIRFADFISRKPEAIGEDFIVVDDSIISYYDFLKYIALLLGRRMYPIPGINLKLLRPFAIEAAKIWRYLEINLGLPRVRVFEVQSATYIGSSYWLSNKKSKDWGFVYRYPDVREGLRDTISWFRKIGWL